MKAGIHPDYHPVVFQDANTGTKFLTRSTVTSDKTIEWETAEGVREYPLVVVEVSADSHPFWTGSRRIVDAAGQVEKFNRRYGNRRSGAHGQRSTGGAGDGTHAAVACPPTCSTPPSSTRAVSGAHVRMRSSESATAARYARSV